MTRRYQEKFFNMQYELIASFWLLTLLPIIHKRLTRFAITTVIDSQIVVISSLILKMVERSIMDSKYSVCKFRVKFIDSFTRKFQKWS